LTRKAHVGEFGSAEDVLEACEVLELQEVHHGIAAVQSIPVMSWLARNKIQLNIWPTSNIMLGRVEGYREHPIRILYEHGIPVTINTDDLLIFNQSVSQEYMNLFQAGLMTAEELDEIRLTGLSNIHSAK
jgi:adenosine deaminase